MAEPKSNHQVKVVRIGEIEKHPNADSLGIVRIGGYQCVVKLGNYQPGDLAIYIQPDSVVPQEEPYAFLWADKEFPDGVVPEKSRRITVRRFRKEWSEGLLMPLLDFFSYDDDVTEGDDVAERLGITHYDPPDPETRLHSQGHNYDRGVRPKSLKGWFYWLLRKLGFDVNGPTGGENERAPACFPPVYDVEAYKNFQGVLQPGEEVIATEKIHGSNARYVYQKKKMYAGSRQLWKSPESKCIWREVLKQHPWIEEWCREHEGYTLYGEVFPTQKFKGGKTVHYGCGAGEVGFRVFDVRTPDGEWMPLDAVLLDVGILQCVPTMYWGPFDEAKIRELADGPSAVAGADHIREGVVIRPTVERQERGLGRVHLKIVSNQFLEQS